MENSENKKVIDLEEFKKGKKERDELYKKLCEEEDRKLGAEPGTSKLADEMLKNNELEFKIEEDWKKRKKKGLENPQK